MHDVSAGGRQSSGTFYRIGALAARPTLRRVHNDGGMTVAVIIAVLALTGRPGPQRMADGPAVKEWIDAVTAHRPGTIDAPLITIGNAPLADLQQIRQNVASVLEQHVASVDERNAILRRGALLHMDIALLLPEEASRFTENDVPESHGRQEVARIFHSTDGRVAGLTVDTAHWWFASELLKQIRPDPAADPFVVAWHRAVIAYFESMGSFGVPSFAIPRALTVVPDDPLILMYAGALHDVTASDHMQALRDDRRVHIRDADAELKEAEKYFRRSVDEGGPLEARIRLGRVLGALGRHQQAADALRLAQQRLEPTDVRLVYFASLFLGTEEMALGHFDAARQQYERARAAIPTAQSAIIALADGCFRSGQPACTAAALRDLKDVTSAGDQHTDPWVRYYVSVAEDADEQMRRLRESVADEGGR